MRKVILSVLVLLSVCVTFNSCDKDDDLLAYAGTESNVAKGETYPDSVKQSIDYCYDEIFTIPDIYENLPAEMLKRTDDTSERLSVVLYADDNTDVFGDTIGEGHEYEIICWYLGREY